MGSSQNSLVKDEILLDRKLIFPILGFLYGLEQPFPKQVRKTSQDKQSNLPDPQLAMNAWVKPDETRRLF